MSKELKITKERVLEAAGKCAEAKTALKTLFPEAFEEEWTHFRAYRLGVPVTGNAFSSFNLDELYRFSIRGNDLDNMDILDIYSKPR